MGLTDIQKDRGGSTEFPIRSLICFCFFSRVTKPFETIKRSEIISCSDKGPTNHNDDRGQCNNMY